MTGVLPTVLITAPLAFVAGWLTSKAIFQRIAVIRQNGSRPAAQSAQPASRSRASEEQPPADQLRNNLLNAAVEQLQSDLLAAQRDASGAENEIQLLREAVAEREHRLTELQQQLKLTQTPPEDSEETSSGIENVKQIREMRALQTRAETASKEIAELRHELVATENRLQTSDRRFSKWRKHFGPLAKQFRQQRLIMTELREELRQRDQRREQEARMKEQRSATKPPSPPPVAARREPTMNPEDFDNSHDNLEELRGIGPALSRKLNEKGIVSFRQLAGLSQQELLKLGNTLGLSTKMVKKHDWPTQARQKLGLPLDMGVDVAGSLPA